MLKIHFFIKCIDRNIYPTEAELDILCYLHNIGGIKGKEQNRAFINDCITRKFMKHSHSVGNVLSKYTDLGFIRKVKNCEKYIHEDILPIIKDDVFVLQYLMTNIEIK